MTIFERAFRKAARTAARWNYEYERRKRQRQLEKAMPRIVYRGKLIAAARKGHKACKAMVEANRKEMLFELRSDIAANDCAHIAVRDVAGWE